MNPDRTWVVLAVLAASGVAAGKGEVPMHERIAADARDDMAMGVVLEGDIPAAIQTRSGVFSAPDPNRAASRDELRASANALRDAMQGSSSFSGTDTFTPDRDTRRPDVLSYVDPFTPATAPFKRLVAFDAVDAQFALFTRDARLTALPIQHGQALAGEDVFYADLAIEVGPDRHTRIPSVGPGARVLHAHLGDGARDLPVRLERDAADNWFIDSLEPASARLVMELAIPRETFGGDLGDPDWSALATPPVPGVVAAAAVPVMAKIGLSRGVRPAENVRRMVSYFRAFQDSDQPLQASKDVYTDLALSQKGVCRHRAYAFTITALALGIPTRMVMNEAHAWVEVNDGRMWKRIDLGGAGRMMSESSHVAEPYAAPHDAYPWPANATRGDDMVEKGHDLSGGNGGGSGSSTGSGAAAGTGTAAATATAPDSRPAAKVTLDVAERETMRGGSVHVQG